MTAWFQPHVVKSLVVRSKGIAHSQVLAYQLLTSHGAEYDYVLRARPDLHIGLPISSWGIDWSKLSFVGPFGVMCASSCNHAGLPLEELLIKGCPLCNDDKMLCMCARSAVT